MKVNEVIEVLKSIQKNYGNTEICINGEYTPNECPEYIEIYTMANVLAFNRVGIDEINKEEEEINQPKTVSLDEILDIIDQTIQNTKSLMEQLSTPVSVSMSKVVNSEDIGRFYSLQCQIEGLYSLKRVLCKYYGEFKVFGEVGGIVPYKHSRENEDVI